MYITDLDLQRLFTLLPRSDDGTETTLPRVIPDTIQPVVELFPTADRLPINQLTLERIQATGAAPANQTGVLVVPAGQRWVVWRATVAHSDGLNNRFLTVLISQPGIAQARVAAITSINVGVGAHVVMNRPTLLQPAGEIQGFSGANLAAGIISLDILITRFTDPAVIPQVEIGF